jgi:hypothetical protein
MGHAATLGSRPGLSRMRRMSMLIVAATTALTALTPLTLAATASAVARPARLMALPGTSSDGGSLMSDGLRYVAYTSANGIEVLDTKTGGRAAIASPSCPGVPGQPAGEDAPIGLSRGEIIMSCPATHSLRVTELATPGLSREVSYAPAPGITSAQSAAGTQWARFPSCQYAGAGNVSCDAEQLFSLSSGTPYPSTIRPQAAAYADLDSTTLMQPLCAPIKLKQARLEGGGAYERVEGVEGPWLLLRSLGAPASRNVPRLLAWRCGRSRPIDLGTLAGRPQIGAGIVTWQDTNGFIHAENLSTTKHSRWKLHRASWVVVHTASTIFVAQAGTARAVYSASIRQLGRASYSGPAPAVVAPPEGTATS